MTAKPSEPDLVERLWELAKSFEIIDEDGLTVTYSDGAILVEAAQEIERLRKELRLKIAEDKPWPIPEQT